jgi:glycine/D-amino acid oxidase-like deaminating enzyme
MKSKLHVAVIGAGAFGGWTALHLLERGARVTLLDAWGPGNSRSSSGGETRIMRGTYGPDQPYTALAARALKLWGKYERRWKRKFLHRTGVLWMVSSAEDGYERGSIAVLREEGIQCKELSVAEMRRRWPQINFHGVHWGIVEPECGYLEARASCGAVVQAFATGGGEYRQAAVVGGSGSAGGKTAGPSTPPSIPAGMEGSGQDDRFGLEDGFWRGLKLSDESRLKADCYVFACGPWLGKLFPETLGSVIRPTKQDILFFGTRAGDSRFTDAQLPVWGDHLSGEYEGRFFYGIPGSGRRGFKVADDTRGARFDPTDGERVVSPAALKRVRQYLEFRFPAMKDAPLIETRVCQYEQTPDGNFILDRHPGMENVWLLGGGSGHGFKHGPALGEIMAGMVFGDTKIEKRWGLARFSGKAGSQP